MLKEHTNMMATLTAKNKCHNYKYNITTSNAKALARDPPTSLLDNVLKQYQKIQPPANGLLKSFKKQ